MSGRAPSATTSISARCSTKNPLRPSGRRGRGPRRRRGRVRWVPRQGLWNPPPHPSPLRPQGRRGSDAMRRVGIDVGGTNTDAVLLEDGRVVHAVKSPTAEDVTGGIVTALGLLSTQSGVAR